MCFVLKFDGKEKDALEQNQFTLKLTKEQFVKLNLDAFKKFDSDTSGLDFNELYFIKNKDYEYLLMIGHKIATSGIGHYYRNFRLFPLVIDKPIVEFDSLSDDPRSIRIADSGTINYTQMDSTYFGAVKVDDLYIKSFKETVSLFTFDFSADKKAEFSFNCKNWE